MALNYYQAIEEKSDVTSQQNDPKLKSQLRRTRIKLLFEDFENELQYLESRNSEIAQENTKLRKENDELHTQLKDQETRYLQYLKRSTELDKEKVQNGNVDDEMNADISTIMKLSSKLQEVMAINENMTKSNASLKQDFKILREEKERILEDNKKLKEQQSFINSPQTYNQYALITLRSKVENYEVETEQLKKALQKSDEYIEKLSHEIERYKILANRKSPGFLSDCTESSDRINLIQQNEEHLESYKKKIESENKSASATLQSLVRNNDQTTSQWTLSPVDEDNRTDEISMNNKERTKAVEGKRAKDSDEAVISDPLRFPASLKLLELTKARHFTTDTNHVSPTLNYSKRMRSPELSPSGGYSSLNSHNRYSPNNDERPTMYNRDSDNDGITIVMPSSEAGPPWLQHPSTKPSSTSRHVSSNEYTRSKQGGYEYTSSWKKPTSVIFNKSRPTVSHINTTNKYCGSNDSDFVSPKKIKTEMFYE